MCTHTKIQGNVRKGGCALLKKAISNPALCNPAKNIYFYEAHRAELLVVMSEMCNYAVCITEVILSGAVLMECIILRDVSIFVAFINCGAEHNALFLHYIAICITYRF